MGLFDRIKPIQGTVTSYTRAECKTYEQAYAYFQYNVKRWAKKVGSADGADYEANIAKLPIWTKEMAGTGEKTAKGKEKRKGVIKRTSDGKVYLEISLHSMPLYWQQDAATHKVSGQTVPLEVDIKKWVVDKETNKGSLVFQRKHTKMIGSDKAEVPSLKEGWQLLQDLADKEDPDFTKILTTCAQAMVWREEELDDVEFLATHLYHEAQAKADKKSQEPRTDDNAKEIDAALKFVAMGDWDTSDIPGKKPGTFKDSEGKTQKKNQYKGTAKGRLGHDRAKTKVKKDVEGVG